MKVSNTKYKNITGVILAGGKSSRMQQDKALLPLGEKRIIEHVVRNLSQVCSSLLLSSNTNNYDFLGIETVPDNFRNQGPAAGLEAILAHLKTDACVVVSCDTPLVSPDFLRFIIQNSNGYHAVIPQHNGHIEPMTAFYTKSMSPIFTQAMQNGLKSPPKIAKKAKHLLLEVPVHKFRYAEWMFKSINTPEDYNEVSAYLLNK